MTYNQELFNNYYKCSCCDEEWEEVSDYMSPDICFYCNTEVYPEESEAIIEPNQKFLEDYSNDEPYLSFCGNY